MQNYLVNESEGTRKWAETTSSLTSPDNLSDLVGFPDWLGFWEAPFPADSGDSDASYLA